MGTPTEPRDTAPARHRGGRWTLVVAGVLWVSAVAYGMSVMLSYQATSGPRADAVQTWPADSSLRRSPDRPTLVVLLHPQCVCSRATLNELNVILQRFDGRVTAHVLFMRPHDMPDRWEETDTWHRARTLPGAAVHIDPDGTEAKRFRGYTSGQTFLYDAGGRLLFNGGITTARGHEGDNLGRRAVLALLGGEAHGPLVHKVFGCLLFSGDDLSRVSGEGL